jgi:hypothetical protein
MKNLNKRTIELTRLISLILLSIFTITLFLNFCVVNYIIGSLCAYYCYQEFKKTKYGLYFSGSWLDIKIIIIIGFFLLNLYILGIIALIVSFIYPKF